MALRSTPSFVGCSQLLGGNRLILSRLQPLLDKVRDMRTRFREPVVGLALVRWGGSLREGLCGSAQAHREDVGGRVRYLPRCILPVARAPRSDGLEGGFREGGRMHARSFVGR